MTCTRWAVTKGRPCQREAAEWPAVPGEPEPVAACWSHLNSREREVCRRARELAGAERARIWLEGQPERDRLAAEAERERQAKLATCLCREGLPKRLTENARWYPDVSRCAVCQSWLCASCELVRVEAEGDQCATCRPPANDSSLSTQVTGPHFLITLGGLENFEYAIQLLIRAGARNGGQARVFRVDIPLGLSQLDALGDLEDLDSDSDSVTLTIEPGDDGDSKVRIAPDSPQPDLSGLGDIDKWWYANGYPSRSSR
jgi:hypothetical protein